MSKSGKSLEPAPAEMEPVRKPPFILCLGGVIFLWVGIEKMVEYSQIGFITMPNKDHYGGYIAIDGSQAILAIGVSLLVGAIILGSCIRQLLQYRNQKKGL